MVNIIRMTIVKGERCSRINVHFEVSPDDDSYILSDYTLANNLCNEYHIRYGWEDGVDPLESPKKFRTENFARMCTKTGDRYNFLEFFTNCNAVEGIIKDLRVLKKLNDKGKEFDTHHFFRCLEALQYFWD